MGRGERIEDEEIRVGREPAHDVGLRHLLELRVRERFFLRIEARILEHDDVPDVHRLDRLDRGPTEETRHVPYGASQECADPLRVHLEGREVVLSRSRLVCEQHDLRAPQLPDREQVLPDPRIVQEFAGRRVDRRVDVHSQEDRAVREVKIIHREEVPGHRHTTQNPGA